MKSYITIILFIGFNLASFGQIDFKNPPWEIDCDSLTTQTEMNICSNQKFKIADSILNLQYDKLIKYIDFKYQKELKKVKDTSDLLEKEYLQQLKEQKETIKKSNEDFKIFLNSTIKIIDYQYIGGTIRPLAVNTFALNLTVNQIKVIIDLINEIIDN